eukprot:CAMPEP_0119357588 /NCGR_PEP_ID=MMETSP1334-20130426/5951_1 /TAXON_ID=127549 /ORGANISM="Calcidiscus leptoporus, Strain RCC1130" /LENGTH=143 /DNA_ID=CAMNT_0007371873 /DNA_START=206 /DNA_END=633 /DNA_ORIENTATION=+
MPLHLQGLRIQLVPQAAEEQQSSPLQSIAHATEVGRDVARLEKVRHLPKSSDAACVGVSMTVNHGRSGICGNCGGLRLMSDGRDLRGRLAWCFLVAFFCTWCAMCTRIGTTAAGAMGASTSACAHAATASRTATLSLSLSLSL